MRDRGRGVPVRPALRSPRGAGHLPARPSVRAARRRGIFRLRLSLEARETMLRSPTRREPPVRRVFLVMVLLAGAPGCGARSELKQRRAGPPLPANGGVDDGARYRPTGGDALLLSTSAKLAGVGGIAFGASVFAVTFAAQDTSWANTFTTFDASGRIILPATPVTHVNTDAFTGPLVWTGSVFGMAWEDRRDKDFEIYF